MCVMAISEKLKICGAGVAGSYLACLLRDRLDFEVYDPNPKRGCTCAFGCFYSQLKDKLDRVGLNVEDYILCKNRALVLNGVQFDLKNQISINKPLLLRHLWPKNDVVTERVDVLLRQHATSGHVINATGIPIERCHVIPTQQYKVHISGLEPNVNYIHLDPKYVGYGWAFSLDDKGKLFHLGAGCVNADPKVLIKELIKRYGIKVSKSFCSCNRPVHVMNPNDVWPTFCNIIQVGEAGGFVFPLTGEGVIPSMDSIDMFVDHLKPIKFSWLHYRRNVRNYFRKHNYHAAFKVWCLMTRHPRTAWLMGFRFMFDRVKTRAKPELDMKSLLRVALSIS